MGLILAHAWYKFPSVAASSRSKTRRWRSATMITLNTK
jgi:hypothetical protein